MILCVRLEGRYWLRPSGSCLGTPFRGGTNKAEVFVCQDSWHKSRLMVSFSSFYTLIVPLVEEFDPYSVIVWTPLLYSPVGLAAKLTLEVRYPKAATLQGPFSSPG